MQEFKKYFFASLLFMIGFLSIQSGLKRKNVKDEMLKVSIPPPPKNFGRLYKILFGLLFIYGAIALLFSKIR